MYLLEVQIITNEIVISKDKHFILIKFIETLSYKFGCNHMKLYTKNHLLTRVFGSLVDRKIIE